MMEEAGSIAISSAPAALHSMSSPAAPDTASAPLPPEESAAAPAPASAPAPVAKRVDQTVSLRPGGGGRGPGRFVIGGRAPDSVSLFPARIHEPKVSDSRSRSERVQYAREELLRLQEAIGEVPEEIIVAKSQIESELITEDPDWTKQAAPAGRYAEVDPRDWRGRAPPPSFPASDERGGKEQPKDFPPRRSDNDWHDRDPAAAAATAGFQTRHNEPFDRSQHQESPYSSAGGGANAARPAPAILKAAVPWSAKRGAVSSKEKVLRTVKGILNKLTPEKFDVLLDQLLNAGIDSADILQGVISLVFDKAVFEPTFCPMYSELCVHLSKALPEFPSEEADGRPIAFRRILLNICQEEFEGADNMRAEIRQMTKPEQELERLEKEKLVKLRILGNIRLIGELFKQKMIPEKIVHHCVHELLGIDPKSLPAEENIEALCHLLTTVGKQLEESPKSRLITDTYFVRIKELGSSSRLPARIRFMIREIIDVRQNKWVPRRELVKAKTINEIHQEAEQKLGLRPGMRNERGGGGNNMSMGVGSNFRYPPSGGTMPGMPGLLSTVGGKTMTPSYMAGMDADGWETAPASRKSKRAESLNTPPTNLINIPSRMPSAPLSRPISNMNERLLPQGSGGLLSGRSSALIRDASRPTNLVSQLPSSFKTLPSLPNRDKPQPITPTTTTTTPPAQLAPPVVDLRKKTNSLLLEYFSVADLNEALLCVQELKDPGFHPEFIKIAIDTVLEKTQREKDLVAKLLEFLCSKGVLSKEDIKSSIGSYGEMLEEIVVDAPLGPKYIGELLGRLLVAEFADLSLLKDMLAKQEEAGLKKKLYEPAMNAIKSSPHSERILSQKAELAEIEKLIQ